MSPSALRRLCSDGRKGHGHSILSDPPLEKQRPRRRARRCRQPAQSHDYLPVRRCAAAEGDPRWSDGGSLIVAAALEGLGSIDGRRPVTGAARNVRLRANWTTTRDGRLWPTIEVTPTRSTYRGASPAYRTAPERSSIQTRTLPPRASAFVVMFHSIGPANKYRRRLDTSTGSSQGQRLVSATALAAISASARVIRVLSSCPLSEILPT